MGWLAFRLYRQICLQVQKNTRAVIQNWDDADGRTFYFCILQLENTGGSLAKLDLEKRSELVVEKSAEASCSGVENV